MGQNMVKCAYVIEKPLEATEVLMGEDVTDIHGSNHCTFGAGKISIA